MYNVCKYYIIQYYRYVRFVYLEISFIKYVYMYKKKKLVEKCIKNKEMNFSDIRSDSINESLPFSLNYFFFFIFFHSRYLHIIFWYG